MNPYRIDLTSFLVACESQAAQEQFLDFGVAQCSIVDIQLVECTLEILTQRASLVAHAQCVRAAAAGAQALTRLPAGSSEARCEVRLDYLFI